MKANKGQGGYYAIYSAKYLRLQKDPFLKEIAIRDLAERDKERNRDRFRIKD